MNVKAKYKLPTGQFAMQSWDVGSDTPDDVIRQMAEVTQPEWTVVGLIKFPDGINQEFIVKEQTDV